MNLEQINAMGLRLYREPELFDPMNDALQDLGMSWAMWLEQSGTLERLAEGLSGNAKAGVALAWFEVLGVPDEMRFLPRYIALCAAFRVPAVMIEVGSPNGMFLTDTRWSPASVPLAVATLREAMGRGEHFFGLRSHDVARFAYLDGPPTTFTVDEEIGQVIKICDIRWPVMDRHVRSNSPSATTYRVRVGGAKWVERLIGQPIAIYDIS